MLTSHSLACSPRTVWHAHLAQFDILTSHSLGTGCVLCIPVTVCPQRLYMVVKVTGEVKDEQVDGPVGQEYLVGRVIDDLEVREGQRET